MAETTSAEAAFAQVDLLTAELELNGSIYEGFSTAIMVKGQPRTVALCREFNDAVQLMAIITHAKTASPSVRAPIGTAEGSDIDLVSLMRIAGAPQDAYQEAQKTAGNWPPYNSAHEGLAVIHEEFDELKAHVWTNQKRRDLEAMRAEAIQLAATAIRFAADCCTEERGRR